jgi:hypothetical protein
MIFDLGHYVSKTIFGPVGFSSEPQNIECPSGGSKGLLHHSAVPCSAVRYSLCPAATDFGEINPAVAYHTTYRSDLVPYPATDDGPQTTDANYVILLGELCALRGSFCASIQSTHGRLQQG